MHTLETLARQIIAQPVPVRDFGVVKHGELVAAAQLYLDNLSDGYDEPDDLIELLAYEQAVDDMPETFPPCDEAGYSWHDGPYSEDAWLRDEMPAYIASVRSTYGMVSA